MMICFAPNLLGIDISKAWRKPWLSMISSGLMASSPINSNLYLAMLTHRMAPIRRIADEISMMTAGEMKSPAVTSNCSHISGGASGMEDGRLAADASDASAAPIPASRSCALTISGDREFHTDGRDVVPSHRSDSTPAAPTRAFR